MDPALIVQYRNVAESLVGSVDWRNDVKGFCPCPGRQLHTSASTKRDCVVFVDPGRAPSIFCVHTSCGDIIAQRNRALRSGCGKARWAAERGAALPASTFVVPSATPEERSRRRRRRKLEGLASRARRGAATLLRDHAWAVNEIVSPVPLDDDPACHWRQFLLLFDPREVIWIGDRFDSGESRHTSHFRPAVDWLGGKSPPAGPLVSASVFRFGCHARTRENVVHTPFLVVESDTLARDEITAVFRFLRERMQLPLRAIIDTGGRSLHGWFDNPPPSKRREELLTVLRALGCDDAPWREPSMSRLPGARRQAGRETRRQRLLWLDLPAQKGGAGGAVTNKYTRARN